MKTKIRRGQLKGSSLSFLFDNMAAEDKIIHARQRMEQKIKKFSDLRKTVKSIRRQGAMTFRKHHKAES